MSRRGALCTAAGGALLARAGLVAVGRLPDRLLERANHRGASVSLAGGPAVAIAASLSALLGEPGSRLGRTACVVGLGTAVLGAYDDLAGARPGAVPAQGLRGHVGALRHGRVSTGLVKLVGIAGVGLLAGGALFDEPAERVVVAGVVAGAANLVNLLDLRPGRALKGALLLGAPVLARGGSPAAVVAGPLGAAAALLPADLAETTMLGDCGANSIGALLGVCLAAGAGRRGQLALLAALAALTAASELVSFTRVIEAVPGLRELDRLGRVGPVNRR